MAQPPTPITVTLRLDGTINANGILGLTLADSYHRPYTLETLAYTVDTTPPINVSVAISAANPGRNLALGFAEDDAAIERFDLEVNGALIPCTATGIAYQCAWEAGNAAAGSTLTLRGRATDIHGNEGWSNPLTVVVDATAPQLTLSARTLAALSDGRLNNSWYVSNVTVGFTCADVVGGLGIVTNTVTGTILTTDGADQAVTNGGVCIDNGGNAATPVTVNNIDIDQTPPVIAVTGVSNGATYAPGSVPTAGCSTIDATAGVATQATVAISGGAGDGTGSFTATCSGATDQAGNGAPEGNAISNLAQRRATITVAANDAVTCTFTVDRGVVIRGRAFNDLVRNKNNLGRRNAGDPWLEGWPISILTAPTATVSSSVTVPIGAVYEARFRYLRPGSYTVCTMLPDSKWVLSNPAGVDPLYGQPCKAVTLAPGQSGMRTLLPRHTFHTIRIMRRDQPTLLR